MIKVTTFMETLIQEGLALEALADEESPVREGQSFTRRYNRWSKNVVEILAYASMETHLNDAREIIKTSLGWEGQKVLVLAGLLESAYDLMKNGFVGKIKFLLHAELFSSLVEQAKALNETGHTIPAAVLGRIAIEGWLRDQAEGAGIEISADEKASTINDKLKRALIFSVPRWRQIQALLDIGNSAAHGKTEDFSQSDVSKLLEFVETSCA
jgi:hypothetical protein